MRVISRALAAVILPVAGAAVGLFQGSSVAGAAFPPTLGHTIGYYEVASDGGGFTFGAAPFHGSMGGKPLNAPVVGMAYDQATGGYWEVASDGGVFSFTAPFFGSMGGHPLNAPIVGMTATPTDGGYSLIAADGGIFTFGNAQFTGSTGGMALTGPVVGPVGGVTATSVTTVMTTSCRPWSWVLSASPVPASSVMNAQGVGYQLGITDGVAGGDAPVPLLAGTFALCAEASGNYVRFGPAAGALLEPGPGALNAPVVGTAITPTGKQRWEVAADGGIFSFGGAPFFGSMGGNARAPPVGGEGAGKRAGAPRHTGQDATGRGGTRADLDLGSLA